MVTEIPVKGRKPGRPKAIPKNMEPVVADLWQRGYGYRAIANILSTPEHGLSPHFTLVRRVLIRLGLIG